MAKLLQTKTVLPRGWLVFAGLALLASVQHAAAEDQLEVNNDDDAMGEDEMMQGFSNEDGGDGDGGDDKGPGDQEEDKEGGEGEGGEGEGKEGKGLKDRWAYGWGGKGRYPYYGPRWKGRFPYYKRESKGGRGRGRWGKNKQPKTPPPLYVLIYQDVPEDEPGSRCGGMKKWSEPHVPEVSVQNYVEDGENGGYDDSSEYGAGGSWWGDKKHKKFKKHKKKLYQKQYGWGGPDGGSAGGKKRIIKLKIENYIPYNECVDSSCNSGWNGGGGGDDSDEYYGGGDWNKWDHKQKWMKHKKQKKWKKKKHWY